MLKPGPPDGLFVGADRGVAREKFGDSLHFLVHGIDCFDLLDCAEEGVVDDGLPLLDCFGIGKDDGWRVGHISGGNDRLRGGCEGFLMCFGLLATARRLCFQGGCSSL